MVELMSGYDHVLPFLARTLLVFLAETEQESMAECGVFAIDLARDGCHDNEPQGVTCPWLYMPDDEPSNTCHGPSQA